MAGQNEITYCEACGNPNDRTPALGGCDEDACAEICEAWECNHPDAPGHHCEEARMTPDDWARGAEIADRIADGRMAYREAPAW